MTVAKQIVSGVAVTLIGGFVIAVIDLYGDVEANTNHRLKSRESEMLELLVEIRTNQEFLLKKCDEDMKNPSSRGVCFYM